MTEKLTAGPWLTRVGKIRWHLIRLLLRKGDAAILAGSLYQSMIDNAPSYATDGTANEVVVERLKRGRELYYVLRWMQRNEPKRPINHPQNT